MQNRIKFGSGLEKNSGLCYDKFLIGGTDMAFLDSFLQYLVTLIILAALAVTGVFLGRYLRNIKDIPKEGIV